MTLTPMHEEKTFRAWLFSRQEIVEKTAGLVVLTIELVTLVKEVFQQDKVPEDKSLLSHFLNLFLQLKLTFKTT